MTTTPLRSIPWLILALTIAPTVAHGYVIKAPWRGDSLPAGAYISTSGHGAGYPCPADPSQDCAMDMSVVRWDDTADQWSLLKNTTSLPVDGVTPNADYVGWGMPLYSPVDGEVVACWRSIPDELTNDDEPPACAALPEGACLGGGNHLLIRTFDNHFVLLAHLQYNSIPTHLCTKPEAVLSPSNTTNRPCSKSGHTGIRTETRQDISGAPPMVLQGEYIGDFGSSGNSDAPHLHIETNSWSEDDAGNDCLENEPWEFTESWYQERTPYQPGQPGVPLDEFAWERLDGEMPNWDGTTYVITADPVGPVMDIETVSTDATRPAVVQTLNGAVAAFRAASGTASLASYTYNSFDQTNFGDTATDVAMTELDLARVNVSNRHVVLAGRDAATKLRLVPYFVYTDHTLVAGTPRVEATPGVGVVSATRSPHNDGVVVALKNATDDISLIPYTYALSGTDTLSLTRMTGAATSDDIVDVDVATVDTNGFKGVVTVERRANNTVYLRTWSISTGGVATLADTEQSKHGAASYTADEIDVTVAGTTPQYVVLSAVTSTDVMRIQSWSVSSTGALTLAAQYDIGTGGWSGPTISSTAAGAQDVLFGIHAPAGTGSLLSFSVADSDGDLRRVGTVDYPLTNVGMAVSGNVGDERVAVLHQAVGGSTTPLALITHITNYSATH